MSESRVSNVHFIGLLGDDNLNGSIIISESGYGTNRMVIGIDGTNSGLFDVYCNLSDICIIRCQSNQACTNLQLHCENQTQTNCFVMCQPSISMFFNNIVSFVEWIEI